jgi:histidine ammonia-lyase
VTTAAEPPGRRAVSVDGGPVVLADIEQIARRAAVPRLADGVLERVARSAAYAEEVARTRPVYGRSTGVGANRMVAVSDPAAQALRLLRSHATSAGPLRDPTRVRAMLAIRLNQLAAGGNGIAPEVVEALAEMIVADALPPVREWVGIGTGDLGALGTTALALMGEIDGTATVPTTVVFGAGDALTFLSSNAAALGDAALALAALRRLAEASLVTAALAFLAVRGNPEAFAPAVEAATPFPGTSTVCRALRSLTAAPDASAPPRTPARIQDPFPLRTLPQVGGAWFDALDRAEAVVVAMASAPSENPVLSPDLGVAHHGGFFAPHLGQSLDALRSATAQAAHLSVGRTALLNEPSITGDEPFLGDGTPGVSGTMIVEYAVAAALGVLVAGAAPTGLQSVTLSRGLEEGASFAAQAATLTLSSVEPLRAILAGELLTAVRALGSRAAVSRSLSPVLEAVVEAVPLVDDREDRDLTGDLAALGDLVDRLPELAGQTASSSGRSSSA